MGLKKRIASKSSVEVRNPNQLNYRANVDAGKYFEMKDALLKVLSKKNGLTQKGMFEAVLPCLSEERFPGGKTRGWWVKCVQLDLEARGAVLRDTSCKPLQWFLS